MFFLSYHPRHSGLVVSGTGGKREEEKEPILRTGEGDLGRILRLAAGEEGKEEEEPGAAAARGPPVLVLPAIAASSIFAASVAASSAEYPPSRPITAPTPEASCDAAPSLGTPDTPSPASAPAVPALPPTRSIRRGGPSSTARALRPNSRASLAERAAPSPQLPFPPPAPAPGTASTKLARAPGRSVALSILVSALLR